MQRYDPSPHSPNHFKFGYFELGLQPPIMALNPYTSAEINPINPAELFSILDLTMAFHTGPGYERRKRLPLCIWGAPGVGKTEIVQSYAVQNGLQLLVIHPAQFEEMGDLLGMPYKEGDQTKWAPPAWVPQQDGPGILLLDDLNRADARILNGLLALLQEGRLASWSLPDRWVIIATANPYSMQMSVTHMDDAITGRMQHVQLKFDLSGWLDWGRNNKLDIRGLSFFSRYPELLSDEISPREAAQFLQVFGCIPKGRHDQVRLTAKSMLPATYAERFLTWVQLNEPSWLAPKDFLANDDLGGRLAKLNAEVNSEVARRLKLDLLQEMAGHLHTHPVLSKQAIQNLITLFSDTQVDGNMILAFLHHLPASSPLHEAIVQVVPVRSKIS